MNERGLATAAIVCGMLAIGACLMNWSMPRRSHADLQAEAHRLRLEEGASDPAELLQETRMAFPKPGTSKPFHGVWVIVLASLGVAGTAVGTSLVVVGSHHRGAAERALWGAGGLFALGAVLVLLDGSPSHFPYSSRAAGWWLALAGCLVACFCTTFGSTRLPRPESAAAEGDVPADA